MEMDVQLSLQPLFALNEESVKSVVLINTEGTSSGRSLELTHSKSQIKRKATWRYIQTVNHGTLH